MPGFFGRVNRGVAQDVHGQIAQDERFDMATELPVRVKSVDYSRNEATLEVLYKPVFDGREVDFPDLLEVPIKSPRGGGFAVTVPVKPGDYGVARFGQRDMDLVYEDGEPHAPATKRLNSFSDAVFEPGWHPRNKAMASYDGENLFVGTEDHANGLRVTPQGTIAIEGAGESFLQIVSDALAVLIASSDVEGPGFDPGVRSDLTAIRDRLETMKFR